MSEVKNRRENLFINEVPPEVLSADDVEDAVEDAGFVKNTDYASTNTAGVIKTSASYGTGISAGGAFYGSTRSLNQYNSGADATLICKGTLENVIAALVKRELIALLGGADTDVAGTTLKDWFAQRTADGWDVVAVKDVPI